MGKMFNDTRDELRKLFISAYKRDSFDPKDSNSKDGKVNRHKNKKLEESINGNILDEDVPFFKRIGRLSMNPFIKFGSLGMNSYAKLFDIRPNED